MSARISACQGSGPVEFDSSPSPHANACCTNKSGSLATSDDNHAAMSSSSSACSGSSAVTVIFNPTSLIQQIPCAQRPRIAKSSAAPFRAVLLALAFRHQFLDLGFGHHFECLGRDELLFWSATTSLLVFGGLTLSMLIARSRIARDRFHSQNKAQMMSTINLSAKLHERIMDAHECS